MDIKTVVTKLNNKFSDKLNIIGDDIGTILTSFKKHDFFNLTKLASDVVLHYSWMRSSTDIDRCLYDLRFTYKGSPVIGMFICGGYIEQIYYPENDLYKRFGYDYKKSDDNMIYNRHINRYIKGPHYQNDNIHINENYKGDLVYKTIEILLKNMIKKYDIRTKVFNALKADIESEEVLQLELKIKNNHNRLENFLTQII